MAEMRASLREAPDAAVENDGEVRVVALQPIDALVVERRDVAVFPRRKTLQPRLAGMHDDGRAARIGDRRDEPVERLLLILIVDADAALDRHRQPHRVAHRRHAIGDPPRLGHQAGAEPSLPHPVRRAAAIEVDLGIAELLADAGGQRQLLRIATRPAAGRPGASAGEKASSRRRSPCRIAAEVTISV